MLMCVGPRQTETRETWRSWCNKVINEVLDSFSLALAPYVNDPFDETPAIPSNKIFIELISHDVIGNQGYIGPGEEGEGRELNCQSNSADMAASYELSFQPVWLRLKQHGSKHFFKICILGFLAYSIHQYP